jgi:hypothetical protein
MRIQLIVCMAIVLAVWTSATFAGPRSQEIDRVQVKIDSKLEAQPAAGGSTRESTAATMHRQPTPRSIAAAEAQLGAVSAEKVQAVEVLMTQAREADRAGDQSACGQVLAAAQRQNANAQRTKKQAHSLSRVPGESEGGDRLYQWRGAH